MASTDYTVNILMNMRDTISRSAESAARAMGLLDREVKSAAQGLDSMAGSTADIESNLSGLGGATADAASGMGDLANETKTTADGLDDVESAATPTTAAFEELKGTWETSAEQVKKVGDESEKAKPKVEGVGKGAKAAKTDFEQFNETLKKGVMAYLSLKGAQEALKFLELGAQIDETRSKFYGFSGGATIAVENLRLFREATQGTVTDVQGMQVITKLMGMGLVDNAAQMAQVAGMAVTLGDQTQDAGERIMSFAQMLATGSTRRLFEYNISVANVEQRMKDLQATTAGLSKDEAFKLAVLAEGAAQMAKLGDAGLSTDDKLDRVKVALANTRDVAAEAFARILETTGALDALSKAMPKLPETVSQLVTIMEVMNKIPLMAKLAELAPKLNPVYWTFKILGEVLKGVVLGLGKVGEWIVRLAAKNDTLRASMYSALPAEMQTNTELNKMAGLADTAAGKADDLGASIEAIPATKTITIETTERTIREQGTVGTVATTQDPAVVATTVANLERVGTAAGTATTQVNTLTTAVVEAPPKMAAATDSIATSANSVRIAGDAYQYYQGMLGAASNDALSVARATNFLKRSQDDLVLSITVELKKALAAGKITQDEYNMALGQAKLRSDYLTTGNALLYTSLVTNTNAYVTGKTKVGEYIGTLGVYTTSTVPAAIAKTDALTSSIDKVPTKKSIVIEFLAKVGKALGHALGLPGYQTGGIASGMIMVGERGPEMVQVPAGSRVYSHEQTQNITNNFNQTVNTRATSDTVGMGYQAMRALVT